MILKKLTKKLNKIKICAVFTAICFIVSALGTNLYAVPLAENTTQKYEDVFNKVNSINNEYGKITSSKDANSDITVINIQDLHCHPQTQRNISKIIQEIANKYNLKKIYVEGGYDNIDVSWLNSIKDENIRKQVIEKLLQDGILTGSEYYKLTSNNNKVTLKGIDEEKIHKDNVKRLSWLITQQDKYKETIEKVTKEINILENIYVNNRNKKFSKSIEKYLNNRTDTKKFYRKLVKYVKDINNHPQNYNNITAIRLEDYPNINKFLSMVTDSNTINVKKVKVELEELIALLKSRLPFGVYTQLLKETNNFTDNQKSLELINLLCEKENIDLNKNFKETVKLSNLNSNNKSFNPVQLVQEERLLISEIRKALSYNKDEYEITFASDFNSFFKNYLEYKLTDADWKYFESYYNQFRQLYSKYATVDRIKEIEQDFAEINKYYNINDQRNNIFVENLLKDEQINITENNKVRTDEEILKNSKEVIIAVTGGFHSSELEEILAKKEVNTIVITPKIYEDTKQANKKYIELIETQSNFNSQALAYTLASCTTDINKQRLLLSTVKDIIGKNTQELEKILGKKTDFRLLEESAVADEQAKNNIRNILETTIEKVLKNIPQEGMKTIILPNTDEIMLSLAQQLVNNGIYFSKGAIFDIENSNLNGKDIHGIPAEIYSRMLPSLQKALLKTSDTKPLSIFSILQNRNKIFKGLSAIPAVWEEIVFRFVPAGLSIVAMSVPFISFLTVPLSLIFFTVCQNQFIKAHNISKWISENNQNWSTKQIVSATVLNIFPSGELKENFEQFLKQEAVKQVSIQRTLPTLLLSVPYIYSMLFAPSIPAVILAALIGIAIHKFFNSILKDKLSVFEPQTKGAIDLSTDEGKQKFFSLLSDSKIYISDVVNKIDFNNEQQLTDLINTINKRYLYLDKSLETFITELSKKINVNNDKELDFLRNILDSSIINKENIISDLIPKMDFSNPKHFEFIKYFILNKSIQTISINSKLIDKLDLSNKNHLNLITSLSRFSDEIIFKLIDKLNFDDKEQLYIISDLIVNIGFSSTNYIINEVLAKLNLNNQKDLIIFEKVVCNYKFRTEENFETVIGLLDLQNTEHIKTVRKILDKEHFKIIPVFNSLVKHLNFDNDEHKALFQYAIDKVIAVIDKEIVVNDIFNKTIGSLFLEPQNVNFLVYARHQLLDALLKKLIRLRTENLVITNGLATIYLQNQTKLDSIKKTALRMKADIESFDDESIEKLNELLRNIELFENMQKKETTIDAFAQQTGFSLLKPTPTTYLDGRRSTFTSVLKLLPKSLYNVKQHDTTFFMSKDSIDKNKLNDISVKFDAYMKLLDENLYVLNKFDMLTDFSSQFDDVVKHLNIMLDHLSVISESDAKIFRGILERIVEDIRSGKTTFKQQQVLVEMKDNPFADVNTVATVINRIHQKASFDFLAKISSSIGKDNTIEHNIYISKGKKTIGVYNLSEKPIHPDMRRLLIALNNDPDFSTDKKSNIFIKDNILLWTGLLGAHAVRVVIDFNEESRGILADFHEGMIDAGSYTRIAMLHKILSDIGFTIDDSTQKYQRYERLVGIVATLDKDTGLKNDSDFVDLAQKLIVLFDNAAAFNNSIKKKSQIRQTIRVSVLRIMDIYSKMFYVGIFKNNRIYSTANTRKNLNKLLSFLELPLIPKQEPGFKTNLKAGPFFAGRITTYGQNTIDKYINKPIERAFALGSIKINAAGSLEKNNDYNLLSSTVETLKKLSDSPVGNPQETEMLKQGAILSQVPVRDLNLESCEQIGDYVLKTGYMKLVDGRLNGIKGDFIGFKVLIDKNGIIRYSTAELAGFPEQMNNDSGRLLLTSEQLLQLFEIEGYNIKPNEPLTEQELHNYRNKLQQDVFNTGTPVAYGLTLSKPKNLTTRGISATVGSDIYIDKYASPENVGMSAQNKVSLFTGGSYSSHAGIVLREYGKSAFIINDSQIIKNKTKNEMKIKFYAPKGDVKIIDKFKTQEIEEIDLTLELNDIVVIDHQNNKLLLFPNKIFKNSKGQNILLDLQKYIDDKDTENIKNFINQYKNNSELTERIIEYIYYQSSDNSWLEEFLTPEFKNKKKVVTVSGHSTVIKRNKTVIQKFLSHNSKNNVYRFGEKESLDAARVGTKSANQSKLSLLLEQLKRDTGIENVAVPDGMVIGYDILEKLLGEEYTELYQQLETIIKSDFYDAEEKFVDAQDVIARIEDLIENLSEEKIAQYIGKENLEIFKNKLTIVRSSGVGEDSKEYSAAGIAESFGQVEYKNIPKAIKDTLLSFFSYRAIDYMTKSSNIIKPAVLIEEWIDADKAGIMMSEDNEGHRIIQIINGQGEDIVSGRITPYSFIIDTKTGEKTDGNYTNEETVTKENLEKLTKIMEWLEQVEGVPVDIEFLIKDNIIYIVQVRPITTIGKNQNIVSTISQKKQLSTPIFQEDQDTDERPNLLYTKAHIWEELLYRTIPSIVAMINPMIGIPLFLIMQPIFLVVHTIKHYTYDKTSNFIDLLKQDVKNLSLATVALIIPYAISLSLPLLTPAATVISSKIISTAASTITAQVIHYKYNKSVPVEKQLTTHKKSHKVSGASLRQPITSQRDIIARMTELEKNMKSMDIAVDKQPLLELIKKNPLLISMVLETFCRAYKKDESKYTLGELLKYIKANGHTNGQKEKLKTDFRGYFGEIYVKYNAVADIDEYGNIIRLQMPSDTSQAGYDLVDPKTGIKIQIKTGSESIVKAHFQKYKRYNIPVFTVSEVKQLMINNQNPNSNLVFSLNLTKEEVIAFITEAIEMLILLSNDKSLPVNIKHLTLQEIIDICNEATTESAFVLSKEEIINKFEQLQLSKEEEKEKLEKREKLSIFEALKEKGRTIFDILDFTAPVWEELSFRTIPAIISLALITLSFSHFITIPLSIGIFVLSQVQFIRAHIITDWLKTKDSGWLENLSTKDILKTSLLGMFPSEELKKEYKKHSQTLQAERYLTNLIPPTIFLSSIYIITSLLSLANPILFATVTAVIIHSFNNANVELLETLKPVNRNSKLKLTGIDDKFVSLAENNGTEFISIYDLRSKVKQLKKHIIPETIPTARYVNPLHYKVWQQQQQTVANSAGFSLGLTTVSISDNGMNKANLIRPVSEINDLISWEQGYDYFYGNTYIDERIVQVEEYVQTVIASCIKANKHIFFFLPDNFTESDSKTKREFDYIQKFIQNNPKFADYFTFVVGAYDFVKVNNDSVFQKYFNEKEITKTIKKLLSFPKIFMTDSFISKIIKFRTALSIFNNKILISLFEKNQFFTDEELKILNEDSKTEGFIDIYFDDDAETTKQLILEAAKNNKLIVLHMFKDISSLKTKTLQEIYREITRNTAKLFTNDYGLNDIFPAMEQKEIDYTGHRYGYNFFLEEIIKNALVHGYKGLVDQPIGIAIKLNDKQEVQEISTYTKNIKNLDANPLRLKEMEEVRLNGYGLGQQYMNLSYLRSYEETPEFSEGKFFKVKSILYDEIDEQKKYEFEGFTERIFLAHRRGLIILPENMETVNSMLHQGKKALNIAWKIAIMEADDSFAQDENGNYTFAQRHQSSVGKQAATELINFIEKMQVGTKWLNKTAPKLAEKTVRQASIVKHLIIDYRTIKASGIIQAIELFGENAKLNEDAQVNVCIVEDIEKLNNGFTLINTGIKINGVSIFRIKNSNLLMYGAKGQTSIKVAQTLDGTKELKKALKEMGIAETTNTDIDSIVRTEGQGIELNNGLLEIGKFELTGKTSQQIKEFITSALEIKRVIGIMYGQKTLIDLKKLSGSDLIKAIENGKARKVITENQFKDLQLSKEKLLELKEKGIEIYIESNIIKNYYMEIGISGQIIREAEKPYIYDYYSMDKTELDEITDQKELINLEQKILNSNNLIMIDIEILKKNFQESNPIEAFSKLGALTGRIKITMGLGNIKLKDIENIGYNIRFEKIPEIAHNDIQKLSEATNKDEIINIIGAENEFAIILTNLKDENFNRFKELLIERILMKKTLTDSATAIEGIELQDKKLEILLGKMLLRQLNYKDKQTIKEEFISEKQLMKMLEQLKDLDDKQNFEETKEQQVLVNTIIEFILYDGQRVKGKQLQEQTAIDISTYRSMLAAA